MSSLSATIFAIKRYALHDGPNIRTTIFFKGSPLNCQWCHNPEGLNPLIRIVTLADKCAGCGECVAKCPEKALQLTSAGLRRDEERCISCRACIDLCPALAHEPTGWRMPIAEIIAEIKKELPFFDQSGGGITCSGGEPLGQPDSLRALLEGCGALGIHRAVDTSGFAPTATLLDIARHTELFLYDLKHLDSHRHQQLTGVANELILANLKALSDNGHAIRVRIPLIGGVNDDIENIRATGAFVAGCQGVQGIDVLPYHPSATAKYRKLGRPYPGRALTAPSRERLAMVLQLLNEYITDVHIGG